MTFFDECSLALSQLNGHPEYKKFAEEYNNHQHIILLGNGGSNAIASHIAQDMTKRGRKTAMSFSDPSMLTCFMNDYGVEKAYVEFLKNYVRRDSLVILISSSGNSENIVRCVEFCEKEYIDYGILTAFDEVNNCRVVAKNALFDYHINTNSYGVAECVHQIFLHGIVECS